MQRHNADQVRHDLAQAKPGNLAQAIRSILFSRFTIAAMLALAAGAIIGAIWHR